MEPRRQGAGDLPRRLEDRAGAAHRRAAGQAGGGDAAQTVVVEGYSQEQVDELIEGAVAAARKKAIAEAGPKRNRMPRERQSITHKFSIAGHEGYITAGMYEDGTVGEIFLTDIGKEGSTLRGMMNAFATSISIALQYGVPLDTLVEKFSYMRFEPEGITQNPEIPFAKSMPDYIMRWLASRFLDTDTQEELGILTPEVRARKMAEDAGTSASRRTRTALPTAADHEAPADRGDPARHDARGRRRADRHPTGRPRPHEGPGPRPGVRPVRRHDAAHGLLLHVLELREQHRLRVMIGLTD